MAETRRKFLMDIAAGSAGVLFGSCELLDAALPMQNAGAKRREVRLGGRRIKTVDIHAHGHIPAMWELVKNYEWGQGVKAQLDSRIGTRTNLASVDERLRVMDEQGVDIQVISINPFWYSADMDMARAVPKLQDEKIAELCAAHPDRFVGLTSPSLQFPFLAAEQLEYGIKKMGMRGGVVIGNVNGEDISAPRFHPFWAKAEELGALIMIHPQGFAEAARRLQGNGYLGNVIGNPLDTTVALAHLIEDGTLDKFPGLKLCLAHGGGYAAAFAARADRCLNAYPGDCKPVKKLPSDYLKQLYFDSIVFTAEELRHLAAVAGPSQVLMGTDFPFTWNPNPVDHILNTPGLGDADREAMLGGTAVKLLRINS